MAVIARALGLVTNSGAIFGAAVAAALYMFAGPPGFAMLAAFFVIGSASTRIAGGRHDPRNGWQAVANAGAAVLFAWIGWPFALVASLAEAAADTVASEMGPLSRGPVFLLVSGAKVAPRTSGGVSVAGTLAGIAAAAVMAVLALALRMISLDQVPGVVLAAATGSAIDSLLGGTLEKRGWLNNDAVNFLGTLSAGLLIAGF